MARRRAFGTVTKRKGRDGYYCLWTWQGQRYRRYGGTAFSAAERKLGRVQALLEGGSDLDTVLAEVFDEVTGVRASMRDLADPFLESRGKQRRETTVTNDRQRLSRILKRASWTGKPIGLVRPEEIERWAARRVDSGLAGPTVNRELSLISRFFSWARQHGLVKSNPVKEIARYSEAGRGRTDYLTPGECRRRKSAPNTPLVFVARCAFSTPKTRSVSWPVRCGSWPTQLYGSDTEIVLSSSRARGA